MVADQRARHVRLLPPGTDERANEGAGVFRTTQRRFAIRPARDRQLPYRHRMVVAVRGNEAKMRAQLVDCSQTNRTLSTVAFRRLTGTTGSPRKTLLFKAWITVLVSLASRIVSVCLRRNTSTCT